MPLPKMSDLDLSDITPMAVTAEKMVIANILLDETMFPQAREILKGSHFFHPAYRRYFNAMDKLVEAGKPIDAVMIADVMDKDGVLGTYGGVAEITNTTFGMSHLDDIRPHCQLILDAWIARQVLKGSNRAIELIKEKEDVHSVINTHLTFLLGIMDTGQTSSSDLRDLLQDSYQRTMEIRNNSNKKFQGLSTGFISLDMLLKGLNKKNLIIVAARPSMGKTSLCIDIARNVCKEDSQRVVLFFSLEMSKESVTNKLICGEAMIDTNRFANATLTKDEWIKYDIALQTLERYKIIIDDRPNLSPAEMRAKALQVKATHKRLDLIIADHTQLISGEGSTRALEVGSISKGCRAIAKQLDVPFILLSQLSRECEKRKPPKPILSDLKDSGSLEEDGDQIVFIYRDEYYTKDMSNQRGLATLMVAKNREAPTGEFNVKFFNQSATFRNLA